MNSLVFKICLCGCFLLFRSTPFPIHIHFSSTMPQISLVHGFTIQIIYLIFNVKNHWQMYPILLFLLVNYICHIPYWFYPFSHFYPFSSLSKACLCYFGFVHLTDQPHHLLSDWNSTTILPSHQSTYPVRFVLSERCKDLKIPKIGAKTYVGNSSFADGYYIQTIGHDVIE